MGLKLEVGKMYRSENGESVNVLHDDGTNPYPFKCSDGRWRTRDGRVWEDGARCPDDLIAEWTDAPTGPVRTVTRTTREIVPGVYDGLDVGRAVNGMVFLAMPIANHCQESIDALIAHLTVIRDALEDV